MDNTNTMNFTEKEELKQKFYNNYKNKILPKFAELEKLRKSLLFIPNAAKFKNIIKEKCLDDIIASFEFLNKGFTPLCPIATEGLIDKDYSRITDDAFYGCYRDVNFQVTECYTRVKYMRDLYSSTERFLLINMQFNKNIATNVHICSQFKHSYYEAILICVYLLFVLFIIFHINAITICIGSILVLLISIFLWNVNYNKYEVKLEDSRFNLKYYVESDSQIEARYVLSPAFMDRLYNLKVTFDTECMVVDFKDNQITFALQTKNDLFEIGDLFTPVTDPKQISKFFDEIMTITDIIDHFKLNERTGL